MLGFESLNTLNAFNAVSGQLDKISGQIPINNKRIYYCQRCLNHGLLEPRKNHKCDCVFASCACQKCILVEKRRVLNTQLHELEEIVEEEKINEFPKSQAINGQISVFNASNKPAMAIISPSSNTNEENSVLFDFEMMNAATNVCDGGEGEHGRIKGERVPNCQKCGQHGRKSRLKGHKRVCPFKDCNCPKCQVVSERQKLMADQIKIRRRQRKDTIMNFTREKITATLNAAAAVAAAGPLPYLNNLGLLYNQLNQNQTSSSPLTSPIASNAPVSFTSSSAINIPPPTNCLSPSTTTNNLNLNSESVPNSLLQTSSFLPFSSSAPTSSSGNNNYQEEFFKAAAAMTSSSAAVGDHHQATSPLQLSQFLFGTSPTAALAALTVAGSPPASLPIPSSTPLNFSSYSASIMGHETKSDYSCSDISSNPSLSNSPSPSALAGSASASTPPLFDVSARSSFAAPINPFANLISSFPTSNNAAVINQNNLNNIPNMPTHEQLLAFLANVQLSSCFPSLNLNNSNNSASEPEGTSTGNNNIETNNIIPQALSKNENKPSNAAISTNFVDICTV